MLPTGQTLFLTVIVKLCDCENEVVCEEIWFKRGEKLPETKMISWKFSIE